MKFTVCEISNLMGTKVNRDLKIIKAESEEEAVSIYKSTRPWIDRYNCEVKVEKYRY